MRRQAGGRLVLAFAAVILLAFPLSGALMFAAVAQRGYELGQLQAHGAPIEGTVLGTRHVTGSKGAPGSDYATVRYEPQGAGPRSAEVPVPRERRGALAAGSRVRLRYVPDAPGILRLEPLDLTGAWLEAALQLAFAAFMVGFVPAVAWWFGPKAFLKELRRSLSPEGRGRPFKAG